MLTVSTLLLTPLFTPVRRALWALLRVEFEWIKLVIANEQEYAAMPDSDDDTSTSPGAEASYTLRPRGAPGSLRTKRRDTFLSLGSLPLGPEDSLGQPLCKLLETSERGSSFGARGTK